MNALRQIRERMGLEPKQLASLLDVDVDTIRNQERALEPRKVYLLAARRVEDMRSHDEENRLDALRRIIKGVSDLTEKGLKL